MIDRYFVPRMTVIRGFQMTQKLIESKGPFPDWIASKIRHGVSQEGEAVGIKMPNGSSQRVPPGSFVLFEGTGRFSILTESELNSKYNESLVIDG